MPPGPIRLREDHPSSAPAGAGSAYGGPCFRLAGQDQRRVSGGQALPRLLRLDQRDAGPGASGDEGAGGAHAAGAGPGRGPE